MNLRAHTLRILSLAIGVAVLGALLSGCLYPQDQRRANQISMGESLILVQHAVDRYREANSVLPIRNAESDTPIYEKYRIDFKKLMDRNYLSQVPPESFEGGGMAIFVLVDVETEPKVKLMDLTSYLQINELQQQVYAYIRANGFAMPLGEPVTADFYRIDYRKLGIREVQVRSVYSQQMLGLLISRGGQVIIDYAPEIMKAMQKRGLEAVETDADLRQYLVEESIYVPVHSFPYYWREGAPLIAFE